MGHATCHRAEGADCGARLAPFGLVKRVLSAGPGETLQIRMHNQETPAWKQIGDALAKSRLAALDLADVFGRETAPQDAAALLRALSQPGAAPKLRALRFSGGRSTSPR